MPSQHYYLIAAALVILLTLFYQAQSLPSLFTSTTISHQTLQPPPNMIPLHYIPNPILGEAQQQYHLTTCEPLRQVIRHPPQHFSYNPPQTRMPDFIIAGVQKAGTSACARNLYKHPDVYLPREEIHFFDDNLARGPIWYSSKFKNRTLIGDKTPSYVFQQHVPKAMREYVPNAKIILILREPIARAFSAYRMRASIGVETRTFLQAINDELRDIRRATTSRQQQQQILGLGYKSGEAASQYIQRGFYHVQIDNLLKANWSRCQIHVAISERLHNLDTRTAEMHGVMYFLGLSHAPNTTFKTFNRRTADRLRNRTFVDWNWNATEVVLARGKLAREVFDSENEKLFEFLGRRISEWGV
jgi:hypothetical protein